MALDNKDDEIQQVICSCCNRLYARARFDGLEDSEENKSESSQEAEFAEFDSASDD